MVKSLMVKGEVTEEFGTIKAIEIASIYEQQEM